MALPLLVALLALVLAVRALGLEWPALEASGFWQGAGSTPAAALAAALTLAVMGVLALGPGERGWPRWVAIAALVASAVLLSWRAPMASTLWGLTALSLLIAPWRDRWHARRLKPLPPPPQPVRGEPRWLVLLVLVGAALVAQLLVSLLSSWRPGLVLPLTSPAERLLAAHQPTSAAVVSVPSAASGAGTLVVHPGLDRARVLHGVREGGGAWTAGRALERLDRRRALTPLPDTPPERLAALLAPLVDAGFLGPPESAPEGLWGVVVEGQHWTGRKRALLSLAEGAPSRRPATRYEALLELPGEGGSPPRLVQATRFVPNASGFEGVAWPGIYLPCFLVGVVVAGGLALAWTRRAESSTEGV